MSNSVGYISFVLVDQASNQIIELGGAGFTDEGRLKEEWSSITPFDGFSEFVADLEDADCSIIENKPVSAEQVAQRLGKDISVLIAKGRSKAAEVNAA
jgi:hypothetical protein